MNGEEHKDYKQEFKDKLEEYRQISPDMRVQKTFDSIFESMVKEQSLRLFLLGQIAYFDFKPEYAVADFNSIFSVIYDKYKTHPEYKVDELLEKTLIDMGNANHWFDVYASVEIIQYQLEQEKNGKSPFRIDDPKVYEAIKNGIIKYRDIFTKVNKCKAQLYENKANGLINEVDKQVQEQTGNRIL